MMKLFGVVLWAMISYDHLVIGFSSLEIQIGCSSGLFGRSSAPIGSGGFCWYAVETDWIESVPTVPRTKGAADVNAGVDSDAAVSASGGRKRKASAASIASFENRFRELLEFKAIHGHTKVPRRHGKLGDWVNKLRQRKDRLDGQRLERLNAIGFCWDASGDKRSKARAKWWERLESLRNIEQQNLLRMTEAGSKSLAPVDESSSPLGGTNQESSVLVFGNLTSSQLKWLRRQRIEYIESGGKPSPKLDETQVQALNEIDPNWWQTTRERKWDAQYFALKDFKAKHGHCNVASAHEDKKLFHWVQNTRKKYRGVKLQREDGLRSDGSPKLSKVQIELLDEIDFNWDPWGHHSECSWLSDTNSPDNKAAYLWD